MEEEKLYELPETDNNFDLYVEVSNCNKKPIPANHQESRDFRISHRISLVKATQKDIDDAKDWYRHHGSCHSHLVYYLDCYGGDIEYCGICGKAL